MSDDARQLWTVTGLQARAEAKAQAEFAARYMPDVPADQLPGIFAFNAKSDVRMEARTNATHLTNVFFDFVGQTHSKAMKVRVDLPSTGGTLEMSRYQFGRHTLERCRYNGEDVLHTAQSDLNVLAEFNANIESIADDYLRSPVMKEVIRQLAREVPGLSGWRRHHAKRGSSPPGGVGL
jgi:hypothetical protein